MKKIFCIVMATVLTWSIHAQNSITYIENQLLIQLAQGVNAYEFAANSLQSIAPKRLLSKRLNIWLFQFTDDTEQRSTQQRNARKNNLSSNSDVIHVQNNHTGIVSRPSVTPFDVICTQNNHIHAVSGPPVGLRL